MARLDDDPLPLAYNYKPLDSRMRVRMRKTRILKLFLITCIICSILIFGYFRYYQPETWLTNLDNTGSRVMDWWKPKEQKSEPQKPQDELSQKPITKEVPPKPIIIEEPPPKPSIITEQPPTPKQVAPENLQVIEEPPSYVPPIHHETSAPAPHDSGYFQLISNIVSPELFIPMMRNFLTESCNSIIDMLDQILTSALSPQSLDQLGSMFKSISKGETHLADAIEQVLVPVGKSSAKLLLSVSPTIGNEIIDSCDAGFDQMNRFLKTSDSQSLIGAFSYTASEYIVPIIGLEKSSRKQVEHILEHALNVIIPDLSNANFHDMTGVKFPTSSEIQSELVNLVTKMASLKAQEKIASTIASQATQYLTGGKNDEATNMVSGLANHLIQSFMGGNDDGKKKEAGGSLLDYFIGDQSKKSKPKSNEKVKSESSKKIADSTKNQDNDTPASSESFVQKLLGGQKREQKEKKTKNIKYEQDKGDEPSPDSYYEGQRRPRKKRAEYEDI